jgi:hypothetical protein
MTSRACKIAIMKTVAGAIECSGTRSYIDRGAVLWDKLRSGCLSERVKMPAKTMRYSIDHESLRTAAFRECFSAAHDANREVGDQKTEIRPTIWRTLALCRPD